MIERITLVLDAFDDRASRLSLHELAHRTQLPRSTVHRILHQLVQLDWVEHDSFGYRLGRRVVGRDDAGNEDELRAAAAPVLHDLHLHTGMVVHLTILDGSESVYLDKVGGRFAAKLPSRVGGRHPAYSTAGGRAMLAWLNPEHVDTLYGQRSNRRPDVALSALHRELSHIRRRRGLAFERGEFLHGVACVAAAVRSHHGPAAGISLCGEARTIQLERLAPIVARAAHDVARILYPDRDQLRRARRRPAAPPPANTWSVTSKDQWLSTQSEQRI